MIRRFISSMNKAEVTRSFKEEQKFSKIKGLFLIGILLFGSCSSLLAQTSVSYTYDSTMVDAMVANGGVENMNFGSQSEMRAFHQIGQQIPMVFRTFIAYDLSAIPEGAIITEAKLRLNAQSVNSSQNHPLYIERVENTPWTEGAITWNNQPDAITSDQISIPQSQLTAAGIHEFDVVHHVQYMVSNPSLNNGWRIRLQSEQSTSDYGIIYHSSEASSTADRPVLNIEYIMPIEMATTVSHCTAGNDDGTLSVAVSGGSTYGIGNMYFYKTNQNTSQRGAATLSNHKTTGNLQYDALTSTVTAENLEPGIYVLRIIDPEYSTNYDPRLAFYKHILVGREGEVTSGILVPNYQYQENVSIEYDKPTNINPVGRANTNYHSNASMLALRATDAPNNYEKASLIKYEIDFDDQLEFSKAEIQMRAWDKFFRHNNSSNAVKFSRVTSDWEETQVTWNTRPTVDALASITLPTTTTIGYDAGHRWDTVNIDFMVDYWMSHPNENFGFEIALETYGATQFAQRDHISAADNLNYVCFEFTPKSPISTAFDDTTNTGSLTVEAPTGTLPYTYLIDTKPLGTLATIWTEIGDSTIVDSLDFFTGDISATEFTFNDLPSGKYYVGVYDNTGTKILDGNGIVNTAIAIYDATDLDLSSDNIISRSSGAQADGKGRLYAELLADDSWGGVNFKVETLGAFYAGFNKTSDAVATSATDLEFGIKVDAQGAYQVIENNVLLASSASIIVGQEISILRDHDAYVIYIDGSEIYRDDVPTPTIENLSVDLVAADGIVKVRAGSYWGDLSRPAPGINVNYPECGTFSGAININAGVGGTIASVTLVNNDGISPNPFGACAGDGSSCAFPTVPIGTYTLTIAYTVAPMGDEPGYSYITEEQVAVGYVVEWEEMVNNYVSPLNTIRKGPGPMIPAGWATANSTNTTTDGYANWVHFETDVSSFFVTSLNREKMMLRNKDGDVIYEFETALIPGTAMAYQGELGLTGLSLLVSPNGVWRIEQEENEYSLFKNNISVVSVLTETDLAPPVYEIAIEQNGSAQYIKTIASFCTFPRTEYLAKTKIYTDGGYYVALDKKVKFQYTGEYNVSDLDYLLIDENGNEILEAAYTITKIEGPISESKKNADNRYEIDFESLDTGFYLLKIINVKGEDHFIRIKL